MAISEQTSMQITAVLEEFRAAYAARDAGRIIAAVTPDFIAYGTGADGKISDAEQYRDRLAREFSRCEAAGIAFSDLRINAEGTVAWIAADCRITATVRGRTHAVEGRMTAVLRGDGKTWRFAQSHVSLPAPGRPAGQSFVACG
jgi:ketosteroid isomerase-like protein